MNAKKIKQPNDRSLDDFDLHSIIWLPFAMSKPDFIDN